MLASKNSSFESFDSKKSTDFAIFVFFEKHDFELFYSQRVRIVCCKVFNQSNFEMKFLPRVNLWNNECTTCQNSNWSLYNTSSFEIEVLKRVRFWIKFPQRIISSKLIYSRKNSFSIDLLLKNDMFCIVPAVYQSLFFIQKIYNLSCFQLKWINRVSYRSNKLTTC